MNSSPRIPNANIRVLNGNAEDMLRYLRCGDVDFVIGLIRDPAPPDLVNEALAETPYVVVARHGHPLTEKRNVTLDDLGATTGSSARPARIAARASTSCSPAVAGRGAHRHLFAAHHPAAAGAE